MLAVGKRRLSPAFPERSIQFFLRIRSRTFDAIVLFSLVCPPLLVWQFHSLQDRDQRQSPSASMCPAGEGYLPRSLLLDAADSVSIVPLLLVQRKVRRYTDLAPMFPVALIVGNRDESVGPSSPTGINEPYNGARFLRRYLTNGRAEPQRECADFTGTRSRSISRRCGQASLLSGRLTGQLAGWLARTRLFPILAKCLFSFYSPLSDPAADIRFYR